MQNEWRYYGRAAASCAACHRSLRDAAKLARRAGGACWRNTCRVQGSGRRHKRAESPGHRLSQACIQRAVKIHVLDCFNPTALPVVRQMAKNSIRQRAAAKASGALLTDVPATDTMIPSRPFHALYCPHHQPGVNCRFPCEVLSCLSCLAGGLANSRALRM